MRNLHKLFYKDYFNGGDFLDSKAAKSMSAVMTSNQELLSTVNPKDVCYADNDGYITHSFELKVAYPGLITGIGIMHEMGVKGELKLGLHFDYTYGFPVIYGSSVKGVLRSCFKDVYEGEYAKYVFDDIFEGIGAGGNAKSIYDRDIFHDAVIISPESGTILVSDTIAPHGGTRHDDPFAEPNPISFLKVAPDVTIKFRFSLKDTKDAEGSIVLSASAKLELFKEILTVFGVGAKTNVGYGQFKMSEEYKRKKMAERESKEREKALLLLGKAEESMTTFDYEEAERTFESARKAFDGASEEYRRCTNGINAAREAVFNRIVSEGVLSMNEGKFDEAAEKIEEAKNYAVGKGIFDDERSAVYNAQISNLELKRALALAQATAVTASCLEIIQRAGNIKTLVDRATKWKKEGRILNDDEKSALKEKVNALRQNVKPREIDKFVKLEQQLYDIAEVR